MIVQAHGFIYMNLTGAGIACPHKPVCEPCFLRYKANGKATKQREGDQRGPARPAAVPLAPAHASAPPLARLLRVSKGIRIP